MTEGCICGCSDDVQASFRFSVNAVSVLPERHAFVAGHFKCGGGVRVGDGCVVECNCDLCSVFAGPGCDEC